jgi:hypothetical protein
MRKLTIEGKPVPIWMETQEDVTKMISMCREVESYGYVEAKCAMAVQAALMEGLVPVITCPLDDMESFLQRKQPVLFCIEKVRCKIGTRVNPLKEKVVRLRLQYPGLVAYGESPPLHSGERSVWGIPHQHAMCFEEFGYS